MTYWKLDETSGTTASDSSGNNYSGSPTNGPLWTLGKINGAVSFDGADDLVTISNYSLLNNLKSFTYSAWIYPTGWGEGGYGRIVSKESTAKFDDVYFLVNGPAGNTFSFSLTNTSSASFETIAVPNSILLNTWQHIAATYNDLKGM